MTIEFSAENGGEGAVALPSWSHYYDFDLTWSQHIKNVCNHLPLMLAVRRYRPRRVLEVGAGTGSLATFLSYFGPDVVSVDISPEVLSRAERNNRRLRGRAQFQLADAFALDAFADGRFDVAISQGFFEHFSDDDIHLLLRQQARVARRVVFSVPNAAYGVQDRGDERLMTAGEWDESIRRGGFTLERSCEYRPINRNTVLPNGWRKPPVMYLAVISK